MARRLCINHRLLLCPELAEKCHSFVKFTEGREQSMVNIVEAKAKANISEAEWNVIYALLSSPQSHDVIPKITHSDAVPIYVSMFAGCEHYAELCAIGTNEDPTLRTVDFQYIIPTVTTKEKSDIRKIQKLHSDEFSILHRKAVDFAKALFTTPKELTEGNHKKIAKALRVFAKKHWSHTTGRKTSPDESDISAISHWIAQYPLPVEQAQVEELERVHMVVKEHILALTGACV